jgi:GNAT superfamily N-acetyltransferase
VSARPVPASELIALLPALIDVFIDAVHGGGALGFLPPADPNDVRSYWLSLIPELQEGNRVLVGAFRNGRVVGAGQLAIPVWPNARHRAEIQKVFVDRSLRGHGIGRLLMETLHAAALQRGRTLILLQARTGSIAERLYETMGYKRVGVVPGYARGPAGEPLDNVSLYCEIA